MVVGSAEKGVRSYVAIAGGIIADEVLGSVSTYATAGFGGHEGRALREGDELQLGNSSAGVRLLTTPDRFRVPMLDSWSLRACRSSETASVENPARLFETKLTVASRGDRMGIKLDGERFRTDADGQMPSVPVFPGIIQCPQDGCLFVLSVDAGTTGGYPRVAKVARMDLHLLGQLRPGNRLTFIERNAEDAVRELQEKQKNDPGRYLVNRYASKIRQYFCSTSKVVHSGVGQQVLETLFRLLRHHQPIECSDLFTKTTVVCKIGLCGDGQLTRTG